MVLALGLELELGPEAGLVLGLVVGLGPEASPSCRSWVSMLVPLVLHLRLQP
jgi:hypothetical protein